MAKRGKQQRKKKIETPKRNCEDLQPATLQLSADRQTDVAA